MFVPLMLAITEERNHPSLYLSQLILLADDRDREDAMTSLLCLTNARTKKPDFRICFESSFTSLSHTPWIRTKVEVVTTPSPPGQSVDTVATQAPTNFETVLTKYLGAW